MVEFKIVKVNTDCAELNAAAKEGFSFVDWMAGGDHTALVARDVEANEQRASSRRELEQLVELFKDVAAPYLEQLQLSNLPQISDEPEAPPAPEAAPEAPPAP